MTSRILPREEWHRLVGTEVEPIVPGLDPEQTQVIVVEDAAGRIIGTWVVLRLVHVECLWVDPAHRGKAGVVARLLRFMPACARAWNAKGVWTGSMSSGMTAMIRRVGGIPVPGEHFVIPVGDVPCQQ